MTDRLQEFNVFVRAVESGSFSAAARQLGLSQPSVSRIISEMEARLGVKLLMRNTRRLSPTESGLAFLERARQILYDVEDADDVARGVDSLRGTLKIASSCTFGVREIIPRLPSFLQHHPLLKVEMMMTDRLQDLVSDGADVAIRIGRLPDSGFGMRKLAVLERYLVASPSYVQRRGEPFQPSDLAGHDCIFGSGSLPRDAWHFTKGGVTLSVVVNGVADVSSAEGVVTFAREGLGIAVASSWICDQYIESGALVRLMPDHQIESLEVHAVFPSGRQVSRKVRAFTEHMSEELARYR